MKEFKAHTGGRYTYADDILNLQELALAFAEIFDECPGFIISGCKITGTSISSGYVYLNKKIRYFSGAANITTWPQYICELNRTENVTYESGAEQVGRNIFGCTISNKVSSAVDPITQEIPSYIVLNETGGIRMQDAFLGRYSVLLNGYSKQQLINGDITVNGDIGANGNISSDKTIVIQRDNAKIILSADKEANRILIKTATDSNYELKADKDHFKLLINNIPCYDIRKDGIWVSMKMNAQEGQIGNITFKNNDVYNASVATDEACVNVNMLGYRGGNEFFRNFIVGDGKGKAVLKIDGANRKTTIGGSLLIENESQLGLAFKSNLPFSDLNIKSAMIWYDANMKSMAHIGFTSNTDSDIRIVNSIGGIAMHSQSIVDIYPAIAENGVRLSSKYVLKDTYVSDIATKANTKDVYTIDGANAVFSTKAGGLEQFVSSQRNPKKLCQEIKAVYQPDIKDTGWLSLNNGLYIRQYNNIVCIEGKTMTKYNSIICNLPESIDPPKYDIIQTFDLPYNKASKFMGSWTVRILGGRREISSCNCRYETTEGNIESRVLITYMI